MLFNYKSTGLLFAHFFCLIAALCCFASEEERDEVEIQGKELRELRNELYKFHQAPFSPGVVGKLPTKPSSDLEAQRCLLDELRSLIKLSQVMDEKQKCNVSHFNKLRNYIDHYQTRVRKIADYLFKIEKDHFKQCKRDFDHQLKEAIDGLDSYDRENAIKLAAKIDLPQIIGSSTLDGISLIRNKVTGGIVDFILSLDSFTQANVDQEKETQMKNFDQHLKQSVEEVCDRISMKVKPSVLVYDELSGSIIFDHSDQFTREWLKITQVCSLASELYSSSHRILIRMQYIQQNRS